MDIYISASKIAELIGKNPFKNRHKSFLDLWKKHHSPSYYKSFSSLNLNDRELYPKYEIEESEMSGLFNDMKKSVKSESYSTDEFGSVMMKLDSEADKFSLSEDARNEMKSILRCCQGVLHEDTIISEHEKVSGSVISEKNETFYEKNLVPLGSKRDFRMILRGRVDGIDKTKREIVEVKRRMNGFFDEIPTYEKIQIHAYMCLSNLSACRLIQSFEGGIRSEVFEFDPKYWTKICKRLLRVCAKLHRCIHDTDQEYKKSIILKAF